MITGTQILNGLNLALATLTKRPVYRDALPEGFERPSCFIELTERSETRAAASLIEVTQKLCVTCIGALDADGNADTDALETAADHVRALLDAGFLRVGDRALHTEEVTRVRDREDGIRVTAVLHYFDETPGDTGEDPMITSVTTAVRPEQEA